MLSFFRSVLGLNGSQSPSSETERLRRVSKELARLEREDRRAPLSPRVSAKRKAVENAATPIAPKLRKLTLAVEEATSGSDLGENTPTAEMCSHARGVENVARLYLRLGERTIVAFLERLHDPLRRQVQLYKQVY